MIQQETIIDIADNSGAKTALCVRVLGGSTARGRHTRRSAGIGDVVIVAIKKALPTLTLDDKKTHRCVIIRTSRPTRRPDGSYVRFDHNAGVIIDDDGNPRGTRIFGAVGRELREQKFMKIISLASEVV